MASCDGIESAEEIEELERAVDSAVGGAQPSSGEKAMGSTQDTWDLVPELAGDTLDFADFADAGTLADVGRPGEIGDADPAELRPRAVKAGCSADEEEGRKADGEPDDVEGEGEDGGEEAAEVEGEGEAEDEGDEDYEPGIPSEKARKPKRGPKADYFRTTEDGHVVAFAGKPGASVPVGGNPAVLAKLTGGTAAAGGGVETYATGKPGERVTVPASSTDESGEDIFREEPRRERLGSYDNESRESDADRTDRLRRNAESQRKLDEQHGKPYVRPAGRPTEAEDIARGERDSARIAHQEALDKMDLAEERARRTGKPEHARLYEERKREAKRRQKEKEDAEAKHRDEVGKRMRAAAEEGEPKPKPKATGAGRTTWSGHKVPSVNRMKELDSKLGNEQRLGPDDLKDIGAWLQSPNATMSKDKRRHVVNEYERLVSEAKAIQEPRTRQKWLANVHEAGAVLWPGSPGLAPRKAGKKELAEVFGETAEKAVCEDLCASDADVAVFLG